MIYFPTTPHIARLVAGACSASLGLAFAAVLARAKVDLAHKERRWELLRTMGQEMLTAGLDARAICRVVYDHVRAACRAPFMAILVSADDGEPANALAATADGVMVAPPEAADRSIWSWLSRERRALLVEDRRLAEAPFAPFKPSPPVLSGAYVPMVGEDGLLGALLLESPEVRAFSADDLEVLTVIAAQASLALQSALLARREQRRSAMLLLIAQVSRKVAAILELDTLFADTVRLVQQAFGYYLVSVFTASDEDHRLTLRASSNPGIQSRGFSVGRGEGLMGHAAACGSSVLVNDVRPDVRFLPDSALDLTLSELAIPLCVESRVLGVLDLQSDRLNAFGPDDVAALQVLADQIAVAVEDSNIYERQQEHLWVTTALLQVADAVALQRSAEEISGTVVRLAQMLAGADRCLATAWDESSAIHTVAQSAGFRQDESRALTGLAVPKGRIPVLDRAVQGGQAITCASGDLDGIWQGLGVGDQSAVLIIPLRTSGQVTGTLVAVLDQGARVSATQRSIISGIAGYAAVALENARLLAWQSEETWSSTALLQVANALGQGAADDPGTMTGVVRLTAMLLGVPWSALLTWQEQARAFRCTACYAPDQEPGATGLAQQLEAHSQQLAASLQSGTQPVAVALPGGLAATGHALMARERFLGALLVGEVPAGRTLSPRQIAILSGIASQTVTALERSLLHQQAVRQERLEHELALAQEIQLSFLPEHPPEIAGWEIAVDWRAVRGVGGDFYDFLPLDSRHLGVLIADVSDKGMGAALYMSLARTVIRASAWGVASPAETLHRANRILLQDARSGMFVSVFYAILDLRSGSMRCARAGHLPALLRRSSGSAVHILQPAGIVLGVTDEPQLGEEATVLGPGDLLVLYTDGVTEAINPAEQEFAESGLVDVLRGTPCDTARGIVDGINLAVARFAGAAAQADDSTLVVVRRRTAFEMAAGGAVCPL